MKNITIVVLVLLVIGLIVFNYQDNKDSKQNAEEIPAEQTDAVNEENITINNITDSKIILSNGATLLIDDLPDTIQVSADSSFGSSDAFGDAKLSPNSQWVAITIHGAAHDFGWVYNTSTEELRPVAFQYGGGVDIKDWKNNNEVVFLITSPKPETSEQVIDVNNLAEYPKI